MRVPEEMEKQYMIDRLVEIGVLVPSGQGRIQDLPLPEMPSKIPISFDDILGLKTPSPPLVIEIPHRVNPENDISETAGASCGQTCSCRSESKSESQQPPKYEVADIFNLYGEEYRNNNKLTIEQLRVMYAIEHCRTAEYGFHADVCDNCGHIESAYNSCRNRHCPKCQGIAKSKWVDARIDELLPVCYHHATFIPSKQDISFKPSQSEADLRSFI